MLGYPPPSADGATGFTGTLVAKYLAEHAPGLRWAICGRNAAKIAAVAEQLYAINPQLRGELGILSDAGGLNGVVRQAKVGITTVGPFLLHGEPFLRACIEEGTHYIDSTGESLLQQRSLARCPMRPSPQESSRGSRRWRPSTAPLPARAVRLSSRCRVRRGCEGRDVAFFTETVPEPQASTRSPRTSARSSPCTAPARSSARASASRPCARS